MGKVKEYYHDFIGSEYKVILSRFSDPRGASEALYATNDYDRAIKVGKRFLKAYRNSGGEDIVVAIKYQGDKYYRVNV